MANRNSAYTIAVFISLALISIELTSTTLSKSDKKAAKSRPKTTSRAHSDKWEGPIEHNVYEKGTGSLNISFQCSSKIHEITAGKINVFTSSYLRACYR